MRANELTIIAEEFLKENYNQTLTIPIKINNRLRNTMGSFVHNKFGAKEIKISGYMIKYASPKIVIDTLKHELIHYALYMLDKPYKDGSKEFEDELIKHDVSSTQSVFVGRMIRYSCSKCKRKYETEWASVAKNPEKYRSNCCKESIIINGEVICNGEEELIFN